MSAFERMGAILKMMGAILSHHWEMLVVPRTKLRNFDGVGGPMRTARVDEILGVSWTRPRNSDVVGGPVRTAKVDDQVWWEMQNVRLEALGPEDGRQMRMPARIWRG